MQTLLQISFIMGILYTVLGIPLWLRRVGPNAAYGFRTAKTLSSPEIWYEVNALAGKLMTLFGIGFLAAAAALYWGKPTLPENMETALTILLIGLVFLPVVLSYLFYRARF